MARRSDAASSDGPGGAPKWSRVGLIRVAVPALLAFASPGCGDAPRNGEGPDQGRIARFGSLRDFVLVERPERDVGGWLFVDRFEVTQDDWAEFAASEQGAAVGAASVALVGNGGLPVGGVELSQARAFAAWRFARLPSVAEWELITMGDGHSRFPWGSKQDATRANTGDLGLGEPTPVGSFESGRRMGVDSPYDLVGNVREWTETVSPGWFDGGLDLSFAFTSSVRRANASPALAVWGGVGGVLPLGMIVGSGGGAVPRVVVGADFQTPMEELHSVQAADERRRRTGFRLYVGVDELLRSLLGEATQPTPTEIEQLQRFLARDRHAATLARAFVASHRDSAVPPEGSVGAWLRAALLRHLGEGAR